MTTTRITPDTYAAAIALAPTITRDSARDDAASLVARDVAGNECPRCNREFTATNPANYCHWIPSRARVSSTGIWFGSIACRFCNMKDEAARAALDLGKNEAMPFAYVEAFFHVPAAFANRADIIRQANAIESDIPMASDDAVTGEAMADLASCGLV